MDTNGKLSGPQLLADRPTEQPAVRTTIVGGRPPGSGQPLGDIPRGIEVLVKKAAVDAEFKQLLLAKRAEAAEAIGLELSSAEKSMLSAVSAVQLEQIIERTIVPEEHRRAFLGKAAVAMLAAVSAISSTLPGAETPPPTRGITPDKPGTFGISPGIAPKPGEAVFGPPEVQIEQKIMELLARRYRIDASKITRDMSFVADLKADAVDIVGMRRQFERQFGIVLPAKQWASVKTVGEAIDQVQQAVRQRNATQRQTAPKQPTPKEPRVPPCGGFGGISFGPPAGNG